MPHKPYRFKHGWIPLYPEIDKKDLSTPDARRSREVSNEEFQKIAAKGAAQYEQFKRASSDHVLNKLMNHNDNIGKIRAATQSPWGGITIDAHSNQVLPQGADKYAITVRDPGMDTVSIPAKGATPFDYQKAYDKAIRQYGEILNRKDHHLGVFHDADKGTIDFDPVLVTGNKEHVETIGAYTHATGGAYHFKSGDGFWPPHVAEKMPKTKLGRKVRDLNKVKLSPLHPDEVGKALPPFRARLKG